MFTTENEGHARHSTKTPVLGAVFEKSIYVIALDRLLYREMIK